MTMPFYFYVGIVGGTLFSILLLIILIWHLLPAKKKSSKNFDLYRNGKRTRFFWNGSKHYRLDVGCYDEEELKNKH